MKRASWLIASTVFVLAVSGVASAEIGAPAILSVESVAYGPTALDPFRYPMGLAVDPERGFFVVADTGKGRLVVFDAGGRSRGVIPLRAAGTGPAAPEPRDLGMDARGRLLVADPSDPLLSVLNPRGALLALVEPRLPEGVDTKARPVSVEAGASGRLYILFGGERPGFVIAEPGGRTVTSVGFLPAGEGPFAGPAAICVNRDESLLAVIDPLADRQVHVYAADGTPVAQFGEHVETAAGLSVAVDAAWDPSGNLWIADTMRHSINVFTPDGRHLGRIGGFGSGPGQFYYPAACEFLADGRLVVLERAGARFQVLEVAIPDTKLVDGRLGTQSSGLTGALLATE